MKLKDFLHSCASNHESPMEIQLDDDYQKKDSIVM